MLCKELAVAVAFFAFSLFSSVTLAAANPAPTLAQRVSPTTVKNDAKSFNPGLDTLTHVRRVPQVETRYITNAERLRRGLPLNPPVRRTPRPPPKSPHQPHNPKPSSVPSVPSAPSKPQNGFLEIYDSSSGDLVGFVARSFNEFGEYQVTTNLGDALAVEIDTGKASSGFTNIATTNGPDDKFPFFGAITGFGNDSPNLGLHHANYVYLGGVVETGLHSLPTLGENSFTSVTNIPQQIESAIWAYSSDGSITAHWTNTDSSTPQMFPGIVRENGEEILVYTGDPDAFRGEFLPVQIIKFRFVPTS